MTQKRVYIIRKNLFDGVLADFKQIAKDYHLKLIIEEPLREPLLAIVNLKVRSLSVVSREIFSQEQGIAWVEDVMNVPAPTTSEEKIALQQAQSGWKALLQTDYGYGVTNLQEIKQGQYAALYEGYFVDQENRPGISQRHSPEFLETLFNKTYVVQFTPTGFSSDSGLISAQTHRGFGGFMQHLPNEEEITAYRLHAEFKNHAVGENLSRVNLGKRVFLKAKHPIPALSPIGFSYLSYWYGKPQSPVLFDRRTGFSIPPSGYQIARYFINFVDTQFGNESDIEYSIEQLQSLGKSDYSTAGNVIYTPKHLHSIRDSKTGKIQPPSMYSQIYISDLTADDYKKVADFYFIGSDPSDIQSPKHLRQVITHYRQAQQLFLRNNKAHPATDCEQQITLYQKILRKMGEVDDPAQQDTKALLDKYRGREEKTSMMDKNIAFRRAAALGHLDHVKTLLQLGAQINAQGADSKKTALHQATIGKHLDVVMFLLHAGANSLIKDQQQKTAIDYLKIGSPLHQSLTQKTDAFKDTNLTLKSL